MTAPVSPPQPTAEPVRQHSPLPWRATRKYEIGPVSTADDQSYGMVIPVADVFGDNREADVALIVEAVNSHASLKARAEQAEQEVDVLESNAREQAKLLADTGRRVEELEAALRPFAEIAPFVEFTDFRDGNIVHRQHDREGKRHELTKDHFRKAAKAAALAPSTPAVSR